MHAEKPQDYETTITFGGTAATELPASREYEVVQRQSAAQNSDFDRFSELTSKLLEVPKAALDETRRKA